MDFWSQRDADADIVNPPILSSWLYTVACISLRTCAERVRERLRVCIGARLLEYYEFPDIKIHLVIRLPGHNSVYLFKVD